MTLARTLISCSLLALLAACGGANDSASVPEAQPADASSADIGKYVVHFSAQNTNELPPDVARAYNIVRSENQAMLNISIIRKSDKMPVSGEVSVVTTNLLEQLKNVTMRRIEEPGEKTAIYFIGETSIRNSEVLIFDISVRPDGENKTFSLRFQRQFYTDP